MTTLKQISQDQDDPTINIAIIGEVSCGKSTTLNSMFIETYNETKRKRATCSINMYTEVENNHHDPADILAINIEMDKKINDVQFTLEEVQHRVPQIKGFGSRNPHIHYNIIDFPGINDGGKDSYFKEYIELNFKYLDAIVYISDSGSSMTKRSEQETFEWLVGLLSTHTHCKMIVGLSKYDDPDDDELSELCTEAEAFIQQKCKEAHLNNVYHITRFSAENGYLLRYIKYQKSVEGLSEKNISKLATLIVGSKWRKVILDKSRKDGTLTIEEKKKISEFIIEQLTEDGIEEYYELCSYDKFIRAFDIHITDNLQEIYEGKLSILLDDDTTPGWDLVPRIISMYDNIIHRFKTIGDPIVFAFNDKIKKILLEPRGHRIHTMGLMPLYKHISAFTTMSQMYNNEKYKINVCQEHLILKQKIIDRLICIGKVYTLATLTLKDETRLNLVDWLIDWGPLGLTQFLDNTDIITILENIKLEDFEKQYTSLMIWLISKRLCSKIVDKILYHTIVTSVTVQMGVLNISYHLKKIYQQHEKLVSRYPSLEQYILLGPSNYTYSRIYDSQDTIHYSEPIPMLKLILKYCKDCLPEKKDIYDIDSDSDSSYN